MMLVLSTNRGRVMHCVSRVLRACCAPLPLLCPRWGFSRVGLRVAGGQMRCDREGPQRAETPQQQHSTQGPQARTWHAYGTQARTHAIFAHTHACWTGGRVAAADAGIANGREGSSQQPAQPAQPARRSCIEASEERSNVPSGDAGEPQGGPSRQK